VENKEERKKRNTTLYIAAGVLAVLLVGGGILVATGMLPENLFEYGSQEETEDFVSETELEEREMIETEDGLVFEKRTEQGLDGELERTDVILENFPSEIPLPGGTVISSSDTGLDVSIEIEVNATGEEALSWYVNKLTEEGWEVVSQVVEDVEAGWYSSTIEYSSTETETEGQMRGTIHFSKTPQHQTITITVRYFLD